MTAAAAWPAPLPEILLGKTGLRASALGLGCSRLGSTLAGATPGDAVRLVHHALHRGVTLFDTADIYGQGDSERLLGAGLAGRRDGIVLVSKAGQRFTAAQRIASLVKGPIRAVSRRVPAMRGLVAARRAQPLPRDLSPEHIRRALEGSLKRLGTDWIDLFLLHSPCLAELQEARPFEMLERARAEGLIRHWGVSCDDLPTAAAALRIPEVSVLQVPLALVEADAAFAAEAAARQVALLVREIFTGPGVPPAGWRASRIAAALAAPNMAALIGTTSPSHLDQALDVAQTTVFKSVLPTGVAP